MSPRTPSNGEIQQILLLKYAWDVSRALHFIRGPHRLPTSILFLLRTIAFHHFSKACRLYSLVGAPLSLTKEVQNAIAVHPHSFKVLRQQRLPVLARDHNGADM
jgi:hypothetical protein